MIFPMYSWAGNGIGEAILLTLFIVFYLLVRIVLWIYGIIKFIFKRKIDNWNVLFIIIDVPIICVVWLFYNEFILEPEQEHERQKQAEKLSQITLTAPQVFGGIPMPEGTEIQTDVDRNRTQPEPEKFIYAKFKQPIVWNGIEIVDINRKLTGHNGTIIWEDEGIATEPDKSVPVGEWWCRFGMNMEWRLIPQADGKTPVVPYNQSVEPYVYLYRCYVRPQEKALLPEFGVELPVEYIRRNNEIHRDVTKGFWHTYQTYYSSSITKMYFDDLQLWMDSHRVVHQFAAELDDKPNFNCGMPKQTKLLWQKSRSNVIQVASSEPNKIPKTCWGKTLVRVSADSLETYF